MDFYFSLFPLILTHVNDSKQEASILDFKYKMQFTCFALLIIFMKTPFTLLLCSLLSPVRLFAAHAMQQAANHLRYTTAKLNNQFTCVAFFLSSIKFSQLYGYLICVI